MGGEFYPEINMWVCKSRGDKNRSPRAKGPIAVLQFLNFGATRDVKSDYRNAKYNMFLTANML